jgi:hypothetical protein
MEWTTQMQRWLEESCRRSGVPLKVTDPGVLAKVATLLGVTTKGEQVARSEAAKVRQGAASNGQHTRPKREVGQYGNTRPKEDKSVRRARQLNNDARLQRAMAELKQHQRELEELERSTNGQPHQPYRPPPEVAPPPPPPPPPPAPPSREALLLARELLRQGYHLARVVAKTGVPETELNYLVGRDGYMKG